LLGNRYVIIRAPGIVKGKRSVRIALI